MPNGKDIVNHKDMTISLQNMETHVTVIVSGCTYSAWYSK